MGLRTFSLAATGRTLLLLAVLAVFLTRNACAFAGGPPPTEWAKIAPQDLALKDNPASPGDPAMILLLEVKTDDQRAFETHHVVIKIFKEEGRKNADVVLSYVEKFSTLEDVRGRTIRPDGTIIPFDGQVLDKTVVKSRGLKYQAKTFSLPGVEVGSVIEYAWTQRWKWKLPDVYANPGNYFLEHMISQSTTTWRLRYSLYLREAHFSIIGVPKARLNWVVFPKNEGPQPSLVGDHTFELDLKDVSAVEEEDYTPPEDMIVPHAYFYYTAGYAASPQNYWTTLSRVYAEGMDNFIGHSSAIERLVKQLISPTDAPDAKLRKLYARTQQLRYLSYEPDRTKEEIKKAGIKENKSAEDVLNHDYAWGNDINLFFVALARAAGFDAYPVMLTSRETTVLKISVLDAGQLNGMIVGVRVNQNDIFLDPATRYCPYGLLPWGETGVPGLPIVANGSYFVQVYGFTEDHAVTERQGDFRLDKEGNLEGEFKLSLGGQAGLDRRREGNELDPAGRQKMLQDEIKSWLPAGSALEKLSILNWDKPEEPLRVEAQLRIPRFAAGTGKRLLMPATVFQSAHARLLEHATRKQPLYFRYAQREKDHLSIQAPDGYEMENAPTQRYYADDTMTYSFGVSTMAKDGVMQRFEVNRMLEVRGILFPATYYQQMKANYERAAVGDREKIILRLRNTEARK